MTLRKQPEYTPVDPSVVGASDRKETSWGIQNIVTGLCVAIGRIEGDCEAPSWHLRDSGLADRFSLEDCQEVFLDLLRAKYDVATFKWDDKQTDTPVVGASDRVPSPEIVQLRAEHAEWEAKNAIYEREFFDSLPKQQQQPKYISADLAALEGYGRLQAQQAKEQEPFMTADLRIDYGQMMCDAEDDYEQIMVVHAFDKENRINYQPMAAEDAEKYLQKSRAWIKQSRCILNNAALLEEMRTHKKSRVRALRALVEAGEHPNDYIPPAQPPKPKPKLPTLTEAEMLVVIQALHHCIRSVSRYPDVEDTKKLLAKLEGAAVIDHQESARSGAWKNVVEKLTTNWGNHDRSGE